MRIPKIISILVIFGILLPSFSFAQEQEFKQPETFEEVQEIGERAVEIGKRELPGILEQTWKEEILPIWQKMYDWFKTNIWPKIENWFKKEVEPRVRFIKSKGEAHFLKKSKRILKTKKANKIPGKSPNNN